MIPDGNLLVATLHALATPHALGDLILRDDHRYRRLASAERQNLVATALADGTDLAIAAKDRWGADPNAMARQLHLSVNSVAQDAGYGTTVFFAEYCHRQRTIHLYRPAIAYLNSGLSDPAWRSWLGIIDATPIFLAHEIYHHLDTIRGARRLTRRNRIPLFKFCKWQWMTVCMALSEVAAGSFAQALLNLPTHAKCIDFAALHVADPDNALRLAGALAPSNCTPS